VTLRKHRKPLPAPWVARLTGNRRYAIRSGPLIVAENVHEDDAAMVCAGPQLLAVLAKTHEALRQIIETCEVIERLQDAMDDAPRP
jgi:hypothetical protein